MGDRQTSEDGEVQALRREVARLREELAKKGGAACGAACACPAPQEPAAGDAGPSTSASFTTNHSLSKAQVQRYSRHLLLPSFGLRAQERLCHGSVLIVGCGGLGSPAALYLAAAGVGTLGLVDHDVVDLSNLHRQVIHTEARVGQHKAASAAASCRALNSLTKVRTHSEGLTPANALGIVAGYDVVLDATDNPATRYLISDACVVAGKPLVSAAAVGTDGQLTVYNHGPEAPCYRCLFPVSPAPENCSRCADAGVLGPVPGVMGVLQAVEACKLLGGVGDVMSRRLLIFDALAGRFTTVKLRGRSAQCVACGTLPTITRDSLHLTDYVAFTGQPASDGPQALAVLPASSRVTATHLKALMDAAAAGGAAPPILDVRPAIQHQLLAIPGAEHVPFEQLDARMEEVRQLAARAAAGAAAGSAGGGVAGLGPAGVEGEGGGAAAATAQQQQDGPARGVLYVLCRRGNNSQLAVARLRAAGIVNAVDVVGGIEAWAREVDPRMPVI